jgi:hypothetical protein
MASSYYHVTMELKDFRDDNWRVNRCYVSTSKYASFSEDPCHIHNELIRRRTINGGKEGIRFIQRNLNVVLGRDDGDYKITGFRKVNKKEIPLDNLLFTIIERERTSFRYGRCR